MKRILVLCRLMLLAALCGLSPRNGFADLIYDVSLDTSPLIGHSAGPFSLDYQFNDGSGTGDANNSVTLSNFAFGVGGNASGSATLSGGTSGSVTTQVVFTDSSAFNQFKQGFTPGSLLTFRVDQTTNVDGGGTPDQFTFAILDNLGNELPTQSFFNVFVEVDIDSASPLIQAFASDNTTQPSAGGGPITMGPPQITLVTSAIPEPSTFAFLGSAIVGLGALRSRKQR